MKKINLSVALATYNEEENIRKCLLSVSEVADEVIIIDGSSGDKTVEIAKSLGAKVTVTDNPPIFHINKQKAIDNCSGDWILQLDADEQVSKELGEELLRIVKKGSEFSAFWIKRKNYFLNRWLERGGQYPDPVIRFFKKGKAHLPCKSVHEQMEVDGKTGWLEEDLIHYVYPNFSRYLVHSNRYTTLTAMEFSEKKLPINVLTGINYLLVMPLRTFSSIYFRHRGIVDGFPGFVFSLFSGLHFAISFIKYWEMNTKKISC